MPFVPCACFGTISKVFNLYGLPLLTGFYMLVALYIGVIPVAFWSQEGLELGEQKANSRLSPGQEQRKNPFLVRSLRVRNCVLGVYSKLIDLIEKQNNTTHPVKGSCLRQYACCCECLPCR